MTDPGQRDSDHGGDSRPGVPGDDEQARWQRVKSLFVAAVDLPVAERPGFLERACGADSGLRAELVSLLKAEQAAQDFCETPAAQLLELDGVARSGGAVRDETVHLPPGTMLGSCEIVEFISAGGMGEIYRARHVLLGRDVAIKTVNPASADPDAGRRLLREARHASTLDHPNICTIHEVGVAGDVPFIVMALVEGRPLSEIVHAGVPPFARLLSYAIQVASALEHAHSRGIVHRDLKSSNVVIRDDDRAVVLDFGLARRLPRATGASAPESSVTVAGALAGTVSHMAPEVLLGLEADARSDVWSLGVLLYELATGELPFPGRTPFEISSAILNEAARPTPTRVPLALRLVIERCLAKDPKHRYQTAGAVREALERIRRRSWVVAAHMLLAARRRSVVVAGAVLLALVAASIGLRWFALTLRSHDVAALAILPLEQAPGDSGASFYAAGLTEALSARLGEVTEVRLIAPTSAARAAGEFSAPAEVARAIGADAIVIGRLTQAGDRIRIDARLIAATSGRVLWSDSFERSTGQVLALQADVVRGIAAGIRLALRPGPAERITTVRAVNPEAYEEYLKGRYEWNLRSPASLHRAVAHFTRATELDPTYAPAHAALADCYNQFGTVMVGSGSPREYRPRAAAAAIRALQIDPYSAEAHAALAYVRHYEWQWAEAEQGFRRAIELNPSYALARIWYANLLMSRRRFDEALQQVLSARELDPFSLVVNTNVGWVLHFARRYDDAAEQLARTLALDSTYSQARMRLIDALLATGRNDEAREHAHRLHALTGDWPPALVRLGTVYALTGATDSARAILADLLERGRHEFVSTKGIADLYDGLGDIDNALYWFGRVLEERSNASVYLAVEPIDTPARRDPRFRQLLGASGLD